MANSFVFPMGQNSYVPSLSSDLVVEYSRNPDKFPLAQYCDYRVVDKQVGYWVRMQNNTQVMVLNDNDNLFADGSDSPKIIDGNDEFTFPGYKCVRRRLPKMLGNLAIEQGAWDILGQAARLSAMQLMTARVKRIHSVLTTSGNWALPGASTSNYATATTAGGGTWSSASATNTYIRNSIIYARIKIEQATLGTVTGKDLFLVVNPNVAKVIATSQEFLNFVSQNPTAIQIWENSEQFQLYGLPDNLFGIRCIVDNTVYNSAYPASNASLGFTLSDSYAVILSKQKAVNSAAGGAFSTFSPFLFEDMVVEVFNDPENRRTKVFVTENIDDTANALVSPNSGYLIKVDS